MFRELAGIPIRRIDLANSELALAEPDPLTLANLTTKSLTLCIAATSRFDCDAIGSELVKSGHRLRHAGPACVMSRRNLRMSRAGRATLGAEAAVQTHILILDHDAPGLQRIADVELLLEVERRSHQPAAQVFLG